MALQLVSSRTVEKWKVWKEKNDKEEKLYMSIEAWITYETSLESISLTCEALPGRTSVCNAHLFCLLWYETAPVMLEMV
jgi:hypothetical protein